MINKLFNLPFNLIATLVSLGLVLFIPGAIVEMIFHWPGGLQSYALLGHFFLMFEFSALWIYSSYLKFYIRKNIKLTRNERERLGIDLLSVGIHGALGSFIAFPYTLGEIMDSHGDIYSVGFRLKIDRLLWWNKFLVATLWILFLIVMLLTAAYAVSV